MWRHKLKLGAIMMDVGIGCKYALGLCLLPPWLQEAPEACWQGNHVAFSQLGTYIALLTSHLSTHPVKGRFTQRWRRPPVGQECLAKTWLYEANGGCAGEKLRQ